MVKLLAVNEGGGGEGGDKDGGESCDEGGGEGGDVNWHALTRPL